MPIHHHDIMCFLGFRLIWFVPIVLSPFFEVAVWYSKPFNLHLSSLVDFSATWNLEIRLMMIMDFFFRLLASRQPIRNDPISSSQSYFLFVSPICSSCIWLLQMRSKFRSSGRDAWGVDKAFFRLLILIKDDLCRKVEVIRIK